MFGQIKYKAFQRDPSLLTDHSKVFCAMPWVHFHVAQTGLVTPCCQAPWGPEAAFGDINQGSIRDIWQGKRMRDFRKQMLRGKPHASCARCHEKEAMGWISLRQITNDKYRDKIEELAAARFAPETYAEPVYFDIRFSNLCNLKCRICGHFASSSWHADEVAMGNLDASVPAIQRGVMDPDRFFEDFEGYLRHAREIYFAGGEPLMMEEHYRILDFLIAAGNTSCQLFYNTNLSRLDLKGRLVTDLWEHFDLVNLAVSLDDMGPRLEYQRKNSRWEQILSNMRQVRERLPRLELMVSPTVSVFNALSLPDLHRYLVQEKLVRPEDVVPSLLVHPAEFNVRNLPTELKVQVRAAVEAHLEWLASRPISDGKKMSYVLGQYRNVLVYMDHPADPAAQAGFPERIRRLDAVRNEHFLEIYPSHASMMETGHSPQ